MANKKTKVSSETYKLFFQKVCLLWPNELDVSEKYPLPNEAMRIPVLTKANKQIDDYIYHNMDGLDFHIAGLIEFAIFTFLHVRIRENNLDIIRREDIDEDKVREIINSYDAWQILD